MTLSTIIHRIAADPVGLLLTAAFLAALVAFVEWGIARADDNRQGQSE